MKNITYYLLLIGCLVSGVAYGNAAHFHPLSPSLGLATTNVSKIYQDSRGYLWLYANSELYRCDGYRTRKYNFDAERFLFTYVADFFEAADGSLWIRTGISYVRYDAETDSFDLDIVAYLKNWGIEASTALLVEPDDENNLWIYDQKNKNLYCHSYETQATMDLTAHFKLEHPYWPADMQVTNGLMYVVYDDGLICVIDAKTGRHCKEKKFPAGDPRGVIHTLMVDSKGNVWVYTSGCFGMYYWDLSSDRTVWLTGKHKTAPLSSDEVLCASEGPDGRMWISCQKSGLSIYDPECDQMEYLSWSRKEGSLLPSNAISSIYLNKKEGVLWVGTSKKGVFSYSSDQPNIEKFHLPDQWIQPGLDEEAGFCLLDRKDQLWICTDGNGLFCRTGLEAEASYIHYDDSPVYVCLCEDAKGRMWAGTYQNGLYIIDGKEKLHLTTANSGLMDNSVWTIQKDSLGILWVGTLQGGLQRVDSDDYTFQTVPTHRCIADLVCVKDKLYVGTAYGVDIVDVQTMEVTHVDGQLNERKKFSDSQVCCLFYDREKDHLWVGGRYGISVWDIQRDTLFYINEPIGGLDNIIKGIVEDDKKQKWVCTNEGLVSVDFDCTADVLHPPVFAVDYSTEVGILGASFNNRPLTKLPDGRIVVSESNGYLFFNPQGERQTYANSKVVISGLQIGATPIYPGTVHHGRVVTRKDFGQGGRIDLSYNDYQLTLEFSSMDMVYPERCSYAYRVKELNEAWTQTQISKLMWSNLPPGKYTIELKGCNRNGVWNNEVTSLMLCVHGPWWNTWLAKLCYLMAAFLLILLIYYLKYKERLRQLEIKQVKMEAEQTTKLDEMKLQLFTKISHDLRTPLSLVLSPIEKMLLENPERKIKEGLLLIQQNANRLLELVNQLLDFRKLEVSGETLKLSQGEVVDFLSRTVDLLKPQADDKGIGLTFRSACLRYMACFDADKLQKILLNLLSNALKFSSKGDTVQISVAVNGSVLSFTVADTGKGISPADKVHVFERYYQCSDERSGRGTGLGLAIVAEYVKLMEGTVEVKDNEPRGTVFVVSLPLCQTVEEEESLEPATTVAEESEKLPSLSSGEKITLLFVDDDDDFRTFMCATLADEYGVLGARNGKEALRLLKGRPVNLIISDLMMPEMDGLQLCNLVKQTPAFSHIPFILLTAVTSDQKQVEGLQEGADDYLTKPFGLQILKLRIQKMLELTNQRKVQFKTKQDIAPSEITISTLDEQLITKAIQIVEANIDNSLFGIEDFCSALAMSRGNLHRRLTAITGQSPLEFVQTIRLKRARQYLDQSDYSISEIAYLSGFKTPKLFSRCFKNNFGVTPSEYQNKENK